MKNTNNIDEFIESVCNNIKCKKAKEEIKKELYEHIYEETNNYIISGMSQEEAELVTIKNMGDPKEISKDFNKVYKRKVEWKMLIIFAFLMIFNLLITISIAKGKENQMQYVIRNSIFIIIGIVLSLIVYFIDYKKIQKYSFRNWSIRNDLHNI